MSTSIDASRFPVAAAYLAALPAGLASYPDCTTHASVYEVHVRDYGHLAKLPGIPTPVADLLAGRSHRDGWAPGVLYQVANVIVREAGFDSDGAYRAWQVKASRELFDRPLVRQLMRVFSPTLVLLGATKRWTTFHRGSQIDAGEAVERAGRLTARVTLRYPMGYFSQPFIVALEGAFQVAIEGTRAKEPRSLLISSSGTRVEYDLSWKV